MHFLVSMLSTLGQPGPGARRSRRRAGKANVDVAAIRDGMSVAGVVAKGSGERVAVRGGVLDVMIVAGVAVRRAEEGGREGFRREAAVAGRRTGAVPAIGRKWPLRRGSPQRSCRWRRD